MRGERGRRKEEEEENEEAREKKEIQPKRQIEPLRLHRGKRQAEHDSLECLPFRGLFHRASDQASFASGIAVGSFSFSSSGGYSFSFQLGLVC